MPSKLKVQIHMSLDSFMAGPNNAMDWLLAIDWDPAMKEYINTTIMDSVDHILLGRNLAEGFILAWRSRSEEEDGVVFMNPCPKTIVCRTLMKESSPWCDDEGIEIADGNLAEVVGRLKAREGKGDVIAYGGVQLVQSLLGDRLVDELFLIVEPVTLAGGGTVFTTRESYELVEAKGFGCRYVILRYKLE